MIKTIMILLVIIASFVTGYELRDYNEISSLERFKHASGVIIMGQSICVSLNSYDIEKTFAHEEVHAMIVKDLNTTGCAGSCRDHFCGDYK